MSAEAEVRAFWRGVTASRAAYVDNNAEAWRWDEHKARNVGNTDDADDFGHMAEKHERQAAWLRACAEEA